MPKARAEVTIGLKTGAFRRGLATMKRGLQRFGSMVRSIGSSMAGFGRMARRGFMIAGAGIILAIREASKFRQEMAQVNTMLGENSNIKKFTNDIRTLSAELGIAKSELTKGLYQTLSASVPPENAIAFLAQAAKSAIGGATDIETAVDGLTTVINAFGKKSSEVGAIADQMFTAVKRGKTTFEELSNNIGMVANIAAVAGVKTEELFAAYATLTRQGIKTDTATTGMRAALIALLKPSESLKKKFDELGTSGTELIRQEGLVGAFAKVAEMAGGSNEELVKLIPNVRALPAFLGLTGKNANGAKSDLDAMEKSAGKAAEAFEKMEIARQWPRLWQSILELVERFGDVISRVAQPAVEGLSKVLNQIAESPSFNKFLERVGKVTRGLVGGVGAILMGGDAKKLALEGFRDIVVGSFALAGSKLISMLLKYAPLIGSVIGTGAAKAMAAASSSVFTEREFEKAEKQLVEEGTIDKKFGRRQVFGVTFGTSKEDKAAIEARMKENRRQERLTDAMTEGARLAGEFFGKGEDISKIEGGFKKLQDAATLLENRLKDSETEKTSFAEELENGLKGGAIEDLLGAAGAGGAGAAKQPEKRFSELRRIGANVIAGTRGQDIQKEQLTHLQKIQKELSEQTKAIKDGLKNRTGTF